MTEALTIQQFRKRFKTEEDCINNLIDVKWGNGYKYKSAAMICMEKAAYGFIYVVNNAAMMNR
jgi:hypothetical protein